MAEPAQVLRPTDDEARELARQLLRGARYMSIAFMDPTTDCPSVSRVLTAIDLDGVPVILVSALSGHTKGLLSNGKCALLAGEPGKGDPLAHSRMTVQCEAEAITRDTKDHQRIRTRFLRRHVKAQLYIDFPDFRFFRLSPKLASLNGGFGRAYVLAGEDLLIAPAGDESAWHDLQENLAGERGLAEAFARRLGLDGRNWRFGLADPAGIDLVSGDLLVRHEFVHATDLPENVMRYICEQSKLQ
jgi:heme iron utilization protein